MEQRPEGSGIDSTLELLQRWHRGDRAALEELLRRDLPWIRQRVRERLGNDLRRMGQTEDYLHEAVIEVLRYTPRFLVRDADAFRRILTQIVENMLRDQHDFYSRARRDRAREVANSDESALALDARSRTLTTPSQHAVRNEEQAWLNLALELLAPEDRNVIALREWQQHSYDEIGKLLGIGENTARMRFQRALGRLSQRVEALRRGQF